MSLSKKILLGMGFGIIVGFIFNLALPHLFDPINTYVLHPLGTIFISLIKMMVVPIVLVTLILGTAGISDPKKLGRIGLKNGFIFSCNNCASHYISLSNIIISETRGRELFIGRRRI